MQRQQPSGFRGFVQQPIGRVLLIAVAILVVFAAYSYVQPLLGIPAMLLFGLAIPIWLGLKRPRYLAISGIVIILVVAPVSTLVLTQDLRVPISPASSLTDLPGTNGHALLVNASVSPYTGTTSTNFTWVVTISPLGIPKGNSSAVLIYLYLSTCPGATSTSPPPQCSAGYPFVQLNGSSQLKNSTAPYSVTFHYQIGSSGIWDWQMGVYTLNNTTRQPFFQTVVGDPSYNGLEGPVVGDYWTTYSEVIPTILVNDLLYLGAPFYLILLLYMLFKNRERRRKDTAQRALGPVPPTGSGGEGSALPPSLRKGPPPGTLPAAPVKERTCPNCNAVVYENEATCWKCGHDLRGASPLPSEGS